MNSITIGSETIREIVNEEQYTIRPSEGYYAGDDETDYEVVLQYNGEEWIVFARIFSCEFESFNQSQAAQYLDMLPKILKQFSGNL